MRNDAPVDDTISGIAIKGASQHASPNMGLSRIARSASNTSLPVSEDTGDYTIRGAAAAQGGDPTRSPRSVVYLEPRTRNPLKRSHDEFEASDDQHDARPRRDRSAEGYRSTASALEAGTRDQRRDTGRRSRSPQRLGKIFRRERSPSRAPRTTSSARHHASSDDWILSDRADDRVAHQRSPAERRQLFEDSRRSSGRDANGESWPSPSPRRRRQDSLHRASSDLSSRRAPTPTKDHDADLVQRRRYSPPRPSDRRESSPDAHLNQDERGASHRVPAGLENAPRGPKSHTSRVPFAQVNVLLPDVSAAVLASPHAFISSSVLPTNQTIRNDLLGFMRRFEPMGLHVDRLGYYITFKNDSAGHEALRACIRQKQNSMLYGYYSLALTPFPSGQRELRQGLTANAKKSQNTENGAREEQQRILDQSNSTLNLDASIPRASTLETSSRDAPDDVSSVGEATTTSSIPRCKGTCHVCNEPSSSVRPTDLSCSTCPRRYHRMCTINPPSSSDLTTWQCIRCVRKHIEVPAPNSKTEVDQDNIRPVQRPPDATTELVFGKSIEVSGAPVPRSPPPIQSPSTHREFYRQAPTPEAALSPTHEIDGMTDDAARNSLSEKHAPPASLKLQDKHYDEADELAQQSFTGPHKPTCPADDGGQKPKKPIFVRKKVLKPAQECNVISSNKDPQISAPAVAHPHLQESTISNVSLQRDIGGVSPREMSRTATNPRSDPDSIELGEGSTKKTSEDGTTAAIPKITQPFPEYPSQQAEKARSESRMEVMLPEIPESPSEPRRDDHNTRSEPEVASEKGKDAARARLTSQTARRTKFQHRSCSDCGIIVSTKSSVARFSCLSCQEAPKIASPASGAVEQPGKGPRAEGECRPSQEQIAQLDVHEADIVGQLVTEMPDDGDLTHTATATEPSPDSAAAIKNTVGPSCAESRKVTASPALGEVAGTASSQQARRARGKHNTHPYHRMIGMALCDRGPLQAKAIAAWIVENVPGMDGATEKGSMLGNVSGIVSLNVNRKGKQLFKYRPWKAGDSTEFGAGTWIELQPDKLDKHDRWDPVLKEPVSPPRALKEQSVNTGHGLEASHSGTKPSSAVLAGSKTCTQSDSEGQRPSISPNIDTPRPALEDDESSDEEPLSKIRPVMRRGASAPAAGMLASTDDNLMETGRTPVAAMKASTSHTPALKSGGILDSLQTSHPVSQLSSHQASPLPDLMDIDPDDASRNGASAAQKPATGRSHDVRPNCEPLGLQVTAEEARGKTVEEIIELDSKLVTHSVNSLYVDWPEYAPENHIDKRAIMAEIKKRPTRKQMFGKPACYSRLAGSVNQAELTARFVEQTTSKHSLREAPQSKASDGGKENIKQFDSLEDFFGLPKDPLAILVDGKLAYRDGTRNEDGELLQAKTIYRTGL